MPMHWLEGGGEMGARMRALDWSRTPLGDPAAWPPSLRAAVSLCLHSRYPMVVWWGPELVMLYNDAYAPIPADKHPWMLGRPGREVWPEIWHIVGPMLMGVLERGEATWSEEQMLPLVRRGFPEECYFTFSNSPIREETGRIGGVFTTGIEVTEHVLDQRRIEVLHQIAQRGAGATTVAEACRCAAEALATDPADIPFSLIYELRPEGMLALVGHHGLEPGTPLAPEACRIDGCAPWRMIELARTSRATEVIDAADLGLPGGPWPEPTRTVIAQPFAAADAPLGVLVTGVSPRLVLDARYRRFHELLATHLGSAAGSARMYDQERARVAALSELDRAKTAFFSNVSHELRTPLALIFGPAQAAAAKPGGLLAGDDLAQVVRNAQRLHKLVNQLLDFARIEARRAVVHPQPTDLAALTRDLASAFRSTIERGGLALHVDTEPLRAPVLIDPEVWEKIVLNLLSNAFKFTLEGEIDVTLRERGDEIELRVRDTGVGISPEQVPHVFERFHRIEGVRSRSHEGTGIGLALVQDLVHLQGGRIDVASTEGRGTELTVAIPRARADAAPVMVARHHTQAFVEEARQWLPGAAPAPVEPPPSAARVLLADDNADMRAYITRLLGSQWRVTAVTDGAQALERAHAERPDLVLADAMMPNLDGFELVRAMRADPELKTVPIILLSAHASDEAIAGGLRSGADDYIVKPFSASLLLARVEAQLSTSRAREAAHEQRRRLFAAMFEAPIHFAVFSGPELIVEVANPIMLKSWFLSAEDVFGRPLLEAFPQLADQPFPALVRETLRTRIPYRAKAMRALMPVAPGSSEREERYYDFVYEPIKGEDAVVLVAVDVTDQVRAREVVERALAEARRANQAKDEFLALLGHELRNPMAPIVTALEMMQLRGDREVTREREVIDRQARRLMHLVDDLLDVSRLARGRVELSRHQSRVADVVARSLEAARPLFEQRRQQLAVSVPDDLVFFVDPERMAQVFSNLLTNAAKYTPSGGRIAIEARRDGPDVVVAVRDSGIGISPDMLPHVFEMFTQERQALDRAQGGLGLGLAIVRGLVQQHGGTVEAHSEGRGCGSELVVRLPASVPGAEAEAAVLPVAGRAEPLKATAARRVLIVDDNGDAASLLAEAVAALGHETRVAYDGPTALRVAEAFAPQVALLDLGLPIMDGYELGRRLQARRDGTQLIAVTGYGLPADRAKTQSAGFAAHMVKPVDMAKLAEVIDELPAPA